MATQSPDNARNRNGSGFYRTGGARWWGLVLLVAAIAITVVSCGWFATWGVRAERNVSVAWEELPPPAGAVLLYRYDETVPWPWSSCPVAYAEAIYGTDQRLEHVVAYYDGMAVPLGWTKCPALSSETNSAYERARGFVLSVGSPDYTYKEIVEKHRGRFPTLFSILLSWQEPRDRARCREAQCFGQPP